MSSYVDKMCDGYFIFVPPFTESNHSYFLISVNLHNYPVKDLLLLLMFSSVKIWGSERSIDWPKSSWVKNMGFEAPFSAPQSSFHCTPCVCY